MAWKLVEQPNGLLARWSDIVDNFTDYDMSEVDAYWLCRTEHNMSEVESAQKIKRARDEPSRFLGCLADIKAIHGKAEKKRVRKLLSQNRQPCST